MRDGVAYKVSFNTGVCSRLTTVVVSFEQGDDAIGLARVALDCVMPVASVETIAEVWVPECT